VGPEEEALLGFSFLFSLSLFISKRRTEQEAQNPLSSILSAAIAEGSNGARGAAIGWARAKS
jgi:hypothetical protein